MIKTNKSYTKRLKVTKNGKIKMRGVGHCHFNSRQNRRAQLDKNRLTDFSITNKAKSRFLANA
jgi:ribosomal protein L35